MQRFFRVTPPAVHRMVLALEQRGLLRRVAGQARSIRLLRKIARDVELTVEELPDRE
jgi:repressor LexA